MHMLYSFLDTLENKMSESDITFEETSANLFSNENSSTNLNTDIANSDCKDLFGYSLHYYLCYF